MWYKAQIRQMLRKISDWKAWRAIYTVCKVYYEKENGKDKEPTLTNRDRLDLVLDALPDSEVSFLYSYVKEYYGIPADDLTDSPDSFPKVCIDGKELA